MRVLTSFLSASLSTPFWFFLEPIPLSLSTVMASSQDYLRVTCLPITGIQHIASTHYSQIHKHAHTLSRTFWAFWHYLPIIYFLWWEKSSQIMSLTPLCYHFIWHFSWWVFSEEMKSTISTFFNNLKRNNESWFVGKEAGSVLGWRFQKVRLFIVMNLWYEREK